MCTSNQWLVRKVAISVERNFEIDFTVIKFCHKKLWKVGYYSRIYYQIYLEILYLGSVRNWQEKVSIDLIFEFWKRSDISEIKVTSTPRM